MKKHLTLAEHQALGEKLLRLHSELLHVSVMLGGRYPKNGKAHKLASKATDAVLTLRSHLDDIIDKDCPGIDDGTLNHTYFPGK